VTNTSAPIKRTVSTARPPAAPLSGTRSYRHSRRAPRFTWRVVAAFVVLVAVVAAGVAVVRWYAYSNYYLGNDAGVIAVYQGQPQGVLWYKARKVTDTAYSVKELRPLDQRALAATISEPSLTAALNYAAYLHSAWRLSQPATPTTTIATTTIATSTTIKKAG
jgi:hypothetical protein